MKDVILIAEDYADAREYMTCLLESYGYKVLSAANGLEATQIARKQLPNLILMDMSMPVMDGLTATKFLRQLNEPISKIPIIAVTAFGDCVHEKAIAAGCNCLISKPVDFDVLQRLLKKHLRH